MKQGFFRASSCILGLLCGLEILQQLIYKPRHSSWFEVLVVLALAGGTTLFWELAEDEAKKPIQGRGDTDDSAEDSDADYARERHSYSVKERRAINRGMGRYEKRREYKPAARWIRWGVISICLLYWGGFVWGMNWLLSDSGYKPSEDLWGLALALSLGVSVFYLACFVSVGGTFAVRGIRAVRLAKRIALLKIAPLLGFAALYVNYIAFGVVIIALWLFYELRQSNRNWVELACMQKHCTSMLVTVDLHNLVRHPLFRKTCGLSGDAFDAWAHSLTEQFVAGANVLSMQRHPPQPKFAVINSRGHNQLTVHIMQRGDEYLFVNGVEQRTVELKVFLESERCTRFNLCSFPSFSLSLKIVNGVLILEAGPWGKDILKQCQEPITEMGGEYGMAEVMSDRQPICRIPLMYCGRSVLFSPSTMNFNIDGLNVSHNARPYQKGGDFSLWRQICEDVDRYETARRSRISPGMMTATEVSDARLWQEMGLTGLAAAGKIRVSGWNGSEQGWYEGSPCDDSGIDMGTGYMEDYEPILLIEAKDLYFRQALPGWRFDFGY